MPEPDSLRWICCQIGAREHYAVPRALHAAGHLHALLTDTWFRPDQPIASLFGKRVSERFHRDLEMATVFSWSTASLALALRQKFGPGGWPGIIARNDWFQDAAVAELEAIHRRYPTERFAVFAYSYAARGIFEFAKRVGWVSVLGQIDPGLVEEEIVARLNRAASRYTNFWQPAPPAYWENWRSECDTADHIVVNSAWSRDCLVSKGVSKDKLCIIPLVLQPPAETQTFQRVYPERFTPGRPLRILFLGQAGLRKGIALVVEAADRLVGMPVEIRIVGPIQFDLSEEVRRHPVIRWIGNVPRSATSGYYREADIFLFPTFSDGFGLTQLEAQAWKLPLLVSRFCGEVVENGVNGLVVDPLSAGTLVDTIRRLIENANEVARMSERAKLRPEHRIDALADRLLLTISKDASLN